MKGYCSWVAMAVLAQAGVLNAQDGEQAEWPQKTVITVGDVLTRIDGPKLWTLSGIDYQGTVMSSEDSAYGTVFTIRDVGHLGTAHFLDVPGKPGEIEKENVTSLKYFVDDAPVTPFSQTMDLQGKSFRMERTSKIRGFDLKSSVTLRDDVLIESVDMKVTEPVDLVKAHLTMYAWTPEATVYLLGNDAGVQKRGTFLKEGNTVAEVVKDVSWSAIFDPAGGKGAVYVVVKRPVDDPAALIMIDSPGLYRKIAGYDLVDKIVPVGWEGSYESVVGFFTATEADWEAKAQQRVAELKAYAAKK